MSGSAGSDPDERGVAPGWWDVDGTHHRLDAATVELLRAAVGDPERCDTWFVEAGDPARTWSPGVVVLDDLDPSDADAGAEVAVADHLPPDLPVGCHRLVSEGGHLTRLFVMPPGAPRLARGWGWVTQLHSTRSARSWGVGDLADLARLHAASGEAGATVLAHSPVGAPVPVPPIQPSPYYASSRRVPSLLHVAVEDVPGAGLAGEAVAVAARLGRDLNGGALVDRDRCWALKLGALGQVWEALGRPDPDRRAARDPTRDPGRDPAGRRTGDGPFAEAVRSNARFCALAEAFGGGTASWPAHLRDCTSDAVAAAVATRGALGSVDAMADRVAFWHWALREADRQLGRAAAAGPGLLADLPVGFDPSGADAWTDAHLLAPGCRVGAPPDDFNAAGQDWGLPPYVPWRLRADGYRSWRATLRCAVRHAAALRIDHVMGLMRLWWVPVGAGPADGGYVHAVGTELLDVAVIEAHRAGVALVGEDLGTVDPAVRQAMARRGVYGYRVAWFEHDPPSSWPATTVGMLSTHDLPTAAGLWDGTDAEDRRRAGLEPDPGGDALARARLCRLAGLDPAADAPVEQVVAAAHAALAGAGCDLVLGTLEDACAERHRPNLPGTVDQSPNWRRPLPVALEDLPLGSPFGPGR